MANGNVLGSWVTIVVMINENNVVVDEARVVIRDEPGKVLEVELRHFYDFL